MFYDWWQPVCTLLVSLLASLAQSAVSGRWDETRALSSVQCDQHNRLKLASSFLAPSLQEVCQGLRDVSDHRPHHNWRNSLLLAISRSYLDGAQKYPSAVIRSQWSRKPSSVGTRNNCWSLSLESVWEEWRSSLFQSDRPIMSVRRRASIAGLDFKNNSPNSSGRIWLLRINLDLKYKFPKFLIKLAFIRFEWVLRIRVNDKTFILKCSKSFPISCRKWVWEKNEHCFPRLSQVWQSWGPESEPQWRRRRWWWCGSSSHSNRDWGRGTQEWVFFFVLWLCWGGKSSEWQLIIEPWLTGFL